MSSSSLQDSLSGGPSILVKGSVIKVVKRGQVRFVSIQQACGVDEDAPPLQLILEREQFESVDAYASACLLAKVGVDIEACGESSLSRSGVPSIMVTRLQAVAREVEQENDVDHSLQKLKIIYEDAFMIAFCKSPGVLVQSLFNVDSNLFLLHDLDRESSGIVLFAKSEEFRDVVSVETADEASIKTESIVLVSGVPSQETWTVSQPLAKMSCSKSEMKSRRRHADSKPVDHDVLACHPASATAAEERHYLHEGKTIVNNTAGNTPSVKKPAVTSFSLLKELPSLQASLIQCRVEIGACDHQIVRHLQHCGHSVFGDKRYSHGPSNNVAKMFGLERMFLHSFRLHMQQPHTKVPLVIDTPLSQDLSDFLKRIPEGSEAICSLHDIPPLSPVHDLDKIVNDFSKTRRMQKQRQIAGERCFLEVLEKVHSGPENLLPAYCSLPPKSWARPYGRGEGCTFSWDHLIADVDPARGGHVPSKRSSRKRQQLENVVAVVSTLLKTSESLHVVDFCSGSGHVGLLLAALYPQHKYTLVDFNDHALATARERISASDLPACTVHTKVADFAEPFDVGVALHACGEASDQAMQLAVSRGAAFVVAPCCVGKVKHLCKQDCASETVGSLQYPRSECFRDFLAVADYVHLARAADYTHGLDNHDANVSVSSDRRRCKSLVEHDRLLFAKEHGYLTSMVEMVPPSCTPKNDILVGVPANWPIWASAA